MTERSGKASAINLESERSEVKEVNCPVYSPEALAYPLHAIVVVTGVEGREVEGRRGLSAGQGEVVLAVELHFPHHLSLQASVQMAAVLQALPPPSLGAVAVFAHAKPVGRTPAERMDSC